MALPTVQPWVHALVRQMVRQTVRQMVQQLEHSRVRQTVLLSANQWVPLNARRTRRCALQGLHMSGSNPHSQCQRHLPHMHWTRTLGTLRSCMTLGRTWGKGDRVGCTAWLAARCRRTSHPE